MARGKNAPALFEVIRSAQEKQRQQDLKLRQQAAQAAQTGAAPAAATPSRAAAAASSPNGPTSAANLLKSPLFWFKGRAAHDEQAGESPRAIEPVMREVRPPAETPRTPVVETPAVAFKVETPSADTSAESAPAPAYRPAIAEYARQVREEIAAQDVPAAEPLFGRSTSEPSYSEPSYPSKPLGSPADVSYDDASTTGRGNPDFAIDRDRRQISMRVSYNTAIIAGFAVVVACSLAYLIGSAGKGKTTVADASATQPPVMNVILDSNGGSTTADKPVDHTGDVRASNGTDHPETALDNGGQPITPPTNVSRVVGLQYLVVMSSPRKDNVDQVVKFLADNGIPATAERALPGYSAAWYSVVTARGFEKTSKNPQFDVFNATLVKLMQKYSRMTQQFVSGKPAVYTWHTAK